ncbi:polysaccharide lyase family 1 protein [Viridibacterium curvum]|uniref:Polysaccharide lyase family 1 protein n=1 Tax=Viridibacterium curvum TaxID=1101404 RepID=A0ABP9R6Y1_9RHOO
MSSGALLSSGGWNEVAFASWKPVSGASSYNVYVKAAGAADSTYKKIDAPLVRQYASSYRADVPGLAAGSYVLKVVPVSGGAENGAGAFVTNSLTVSAHKREGFAFSQTSPAKTGSGGYTDNGTPASNAQILYVTSSNFNSVALDVITGTDGRKTAAVGMERIMYYRAKGFDKTPLIVRVIGLIKAADVKAGLKDGVYLGLKGGGTSALISNVTVEGIGDDATFHGFGIYLGNTQNVEIRNLGIMLSGPGNDAISMEGNNHNIWVHNCDLFYGQPGSDADQKKGDGTIDMKYDTSYVTISYNHFFDNGKTTFAGGATESNPIYFTYHHNWFDHSDSRNPRLTHATTHIYNNYMDGNASMSVLSTGTSSAFVEANYFRNSKYPMMINLQGTNYVLWPNGEANGGGLIKAYNNIVVGATALVYQTTNATEYDAYLVTSRSEQIPSSVKSKAGNAYSNFDTAPTMYAYVPDAPGSVPNIVKGAAGRLGGGDFKWVFTDADDTLTDINEGLKTALTNYQSKLVAVGK